MEIIMQPFLIKERGFIMKSMKKLLSPVLAVCMIASFTVGMSASAETSSSVAVYSKSNMSFSGSAQIKGDGIIASGTLSGGYNAWATGSIYTASGVQVNDSHGSQSSVVKSYTGTLTDYTFKSYASFPETTYFIDKSTDYKDGTKDVVVGWGSKDFSDGYALTADSYIRNISINYNLTLYVDVPSGQTRVIRAGTLTNNGNIAVRGGGKVVLYVDRLDGCNCGTFNASSSDFGSAAAMTIVAEQSSGKLNLSNCRFGANLIFMDSQMQLDNTAIQGNLYAKGNVNLTGTAHVNGLVFAPSSNTSLQGSTYIAGKLITNSLDISGSCYVQTGSVSSLPSDIARLIGDQNDSQVSGGSLTTTTATNGGSGTTSTPIATTTAGGGNGPDEPSGDTVTITVTIARRMSIRLENGTILKDNDTFTMPKYGTVRFQVCTNNWDTNTYTDDGQGIAGQKVYEYTNIKGKELYLRVDNDRYFKPVVFHFAKGDYGKQTGINQVLSTPMEYLSVNLPLGATVSVDAYVNNKIVESQNLFIDSSLNNYTWNY